MKRWCEGNHGEDGLCRNPIYLDEKRTCFGKFVKMLIAEEQRVLDSEWQIWVKAAEFVDEWQTFLDAYWMAGQEFGSWGEA